VITQTDVELADGRTVHVYDTDGGRDLAVFWLHGTPSAGAPPEPLFAAAARLGIRWVSYDRPGYGRSTRRPGRNVGSSAWDVAEIADSLGIGRFAVLGHSAGGSHALACGTLLPDRVVAVVGVAGLAPFGADGLNWFGDMAAIIQTELRAAAGGRATLEDYLSSAGFDPDSFTPADHAALAAEWSWLTRVSRRGMATDEGGWADDNLACVSAWGCDPAQSTVPVLIVHGDEDKMVPCSHGEWLANHCPDAELRLCRGDGHVSVLCHAEAALGWVRDRAERD
jgi:pimeloyl-ACP methyl ester carboxylesterase